MKTNEKTVELKISAVDFIIAPLTITFKQAETHQYVVEFDKGAQILKKFDEQIRIIPQQNSYHFSKEEQGRFKLQSERGCNCEWGVYRVTSKEMSEFVDSIPVNLLEHYTAFANSFKAVHWDYSQLLSLRAQGKDVSKLWEEIKYRCKWQFPQLVAKNRNGSIELHFKLEVRCEADNWVQAEKQKSLKTLKSVRSLGQRQSNGTTSNIPKQSQEEDDLLPKNSVLSRPNHSPQQPLHVHFKEQPVADFEQQGKINDPPPQMQVEPIYKKTSVLSDIIECSVECSSNFNDRQKRNELKEISGIPEQQNETFSPYLPNTRTQNFDVSGELKEILKRRSNTYNQLPSQMDESLGESKGISIPDGDFNRDEQLEKEQLREAIETLPHSEITHNRSEVTVLSEVKRGGRAKYVIAFVLCLIFIGVLAFMAHLEETTEKPQAKKVTNKVKKPQQKKKVRKGVKNDRLQL